VHDAVKISDVLAIAVAHDGSSVTVDLRLDPAPDALWLAIADETAPEIFGREPEPEFNLDVVTFTCVPGTERHVLDALDRLCVSTNTLYEPRAREIDALQARALEAVRQFLGLSVRSSRRAPDR
jgi:hypothetical protein